jgi:uncharacterized protein YdeI (BOF family)
MKNLQRNYILIMVATVMVFSFGCTKENVTPVEPPTKLPVIPPPTTGLPVDISSVADIKSGAITKGTEVFLYGYLTGQKSDDDDEWFFTDTEGETVIILDFPTSQVPAVNVKMLVYGGVEDAGEVDVINWLPAETKPETPTPPTFPPAGVTPPALEISTVDQIIKGVKTGEVIVAGKLTNQQDDDCDEWVFNDGTGSIEVEFSSCNVPAVGVPIYIWGKVDGRYEIDVFSWDPQSNH